jgi:hypothetical protein
VQQQRNKVMSFIPSDQLKTVVRTAMIGATAGAIVGSVLNFFKNRTVENYDIGSDTWPAIQTDSGLCYAMSLMYQRFGHVNPSAYRGVGNKFNQLVSLAHMVEDPTVQKNQLWSRKAFDYKSSILDAIDALRNSVMKQRGFNQPQSATLSTLTMQDFDDIANTLSDMAENHRFNINQELQGAFYAVEAGTEASEAQRSEAASK